MNQNFTFPNKDIRNCCRACLGTFEDMILINSIENNDLINMFSEISNIEWVDSNDYPLSICKRCEGNLTLAHDFQQLCRKSNDYIQQFILNLSKSSSIEITVEDVKEEEAIISEDCNDRESEDYSGTVDSDEDISENEIKKKCRKMRLNKVSKMVIEEAIEQFKTQRNKHTSCIMCNFKSTSFRSLSVHMSYVHKYKRERWCSDCNQMVENMEEHKKIHNNKEISCQFCPKVLKRTHFIDHLRAHSGSKPFKCIKCNKRFGIRSCLRAHLKIHTNRRPHQCYNCGKSFTQIGLLNWHIKRHGSFKCNNCEKYFHSKNDVSEHNCVRTDSKNVIGEEIKAESEELLDIDDIQNLCSNTSAELNNFCKACNKRVHSLANHIKKHHSKDETLNISQQEFLCTICNKTYSSNSNLQEHLRLHDNLNPYKCSFCGRNTRNRSQLIDHERTHTKEKPHMCNVCGKGFSQSGALRTHMRQHTGRPEECSICHKRFCRKSELSLHSRKHSGEKPYLCTFCGKMFSQKSHLTEHSKTHSEVRPHQCPYCDKAFKQDSVLKGHIKIHIGEKPFKCSLCSYACHKAYRLSQHVKQHSNEKETERQQVCPICQKGFSSISIFNFHMVSIHNAVI